MKLHEIFEAFQDLHIVVIGDVMIDSYCWGKVDRISPEAPVPILNINKTENRLGGAGNAALNCKSLGAKVSLASVIGQDEDAEILIELLKNEHIDNSLIRRSKHRKTSKKQRIISRNQQMLRLDSELTDELNTEDEHAFIDMVLKFLQIQKPQIVIFEDYNKGVLKENIINRIIQHCKNLNILIAVDPKKINFSAYKGVDIFKPNFKELKEGLTLEMKEINRESLIQAHQMLQEKLNHGISLFTLSENGIFFKSKEEEGFLPAHLRHIADVSGAGDTVISVAAMVYYVSRDLFLMASFSNIAGGLVCEEVGVVPINKEKLIKEIKRLEVL